ncbi:hypothetical protein [Zophobihabitans entericus]|uniref:Uncharacterized protein n=1 Tax=Zophobihabitans entericus TaxID=1635327 RepID=A0A6G9ID55_9GAMM|nr:hypothetical protein [Zophobihabitans entericus]QIQ22153.1 hypothetical protein IPMB12_10935 [Zophobihabitans entericus]
MKYSQLTCVHLTQSDLEDNIHSNFEDVDFPESLNIRFNPELVHSAKQALSSNPHFKGILIPAEVNVDEESYISVEEDEILVMGDVLRAQFKDGQTDAQYHVCFDFTGC